MTENTSYIAVASTVCSVLPFSLLLALFLNRAKALKGLHGPLLQFHSNRGRQGRHDESHSGVVTATTATTTTDDGVGDAGKGRNDRVGGNGRVCRHDAAILDNAARTNGHTPTNPAQAAHGRRFQDAVRADYRVRPNRHWNVIVLLAAYYFCSSSSSSSMVRLLLVLWLLILMQLDEEGRGLHHCARIEPAVAPHAKGGQISPEAHPVSHHAPSLEFHVMGSVQDGGAGHVIVVRGGLNVIITILIIQHRWLLYFYYCWVCCRGTINSSGVVDCGGFRNIGHDIIVVADAETMMIDSRHKIL